MRREIPVKHEIPVDPGSSETTAKEGKQEKKRKKEKRDEGANMDRDERLAV